MSHVPPSPEGPWTFYAHETPDGAFRHVFPSHVQVGLCGTDPIVTVEVTFDPEGPYWAWYQIGAKHPSMIWHAYMLLDMCFPYGVMAEIENDRGSVVRLNIRRIS